MKISTLNETADYFSGKASEIGRQLAFAGIAVVWIIKIGDGGNDIQFGPDLVTALYLFVLSLSFDLLQYLYGALTYWGLNRYHYKRHKDENFDVKVEMDPKYWTMK